MKIRKLISTTLVALLVICNSSSILNIQASSLNEINQQQNNQQIKGANKLEDNGEGKGITKKINLKQGPTVLDVSLRGEIEVYNPSGEHIYTLTSNSIKSSKSKIIFPVYEEGQWYFKIKETYPITSEYYQPWEISYTQNTSSTEDEIFELKGNNDTVIIFNSKKDQTLNLNVSFESTKGESEEPAVLNLLDKNGELKQELVYLQENEKTQNVKFEVEKGINIIEVYLTNRKVQWNMQVQPSYSDIDNHWAESAIRSYINKGYTSGYEDGSFKPENSITRAEFVSIFNRAFSLTKKSGKSFEDTKTHWAKENIDIAVTNGVCSGKTATEFKPNDPITREEAAVMIANYKKISDNNIDKLNTYKDANQVSSWAKPGLEGVVEKQYLGGYSDNTIRPKSKITRAEAVVTLSRVI